MKVFSVLSIVFISVGIVSAQNKVQYGSISGAFGVNNTSFSADYFNNWQFGSAKKIQVGLGARFTSFFGSDQEYSSAPAALANDEALVDTVLFAKSQVNALNLAIHLGYKLSPKIGVGFNIDAVGFSFGSKQGGVYTGQNQSQNITAKPTSFNALLIGNNDLGTLNSEFYVRYFVKENLGIKLAYQFLFTEYTTDTEIQQVPEANDRFRNKASMINIGITKTF